MVRCTCSSTNEVVSLCIETVEASEAMNEPLKVKCDVKVGDERGMELIGGCYLYGMGIMNVVLWFCQKTNIQRLWPLDTSCLDCLAGPSDPSARLFLADFCFVNMSRTFSMASLLSGWGSQPARNSHGDASWWANVDTRPWIVCLGESAMDDQFLLCFFVTNLLTNIHEHSTADHRCLTSFFERLLVDEPSIVAFSMDLLNSLDS